MSEEEENERLYPKHGSTPPREFWAEQAAYRAAHRLTDEEAEPPLDGKALSDDDMRHHTAARLFEQLNSVTNLARHCEHMASIPTHDRIAPVHAAAHLLNASAHVASALAKVTSAEQRQRRIIEHVQTVAAKKGELNANLDGATPADLSKQAAAALDGLLFDTLQRKRLLYMNLVAAETFDPDLRKAYPEAYAPGGTFGEPQAETSASATA